MTDHTHIRRRALLPSTAAAAVVLVGVLGACSDGSQPSSPPPTDATTTTTTSDSPGAALEDALYFYPPVEGATLRYANSGIDSGASDITVDSVTSGADGATTVVVTEQVSSSAGEPVTVERTFHTGADGSLSISAETFAAFGAGFAVTAAGDDILIPPVADLESGQESTGETFVELSGSGVSMRNDVTYTVTGAGSESITVPAGTVEAYVVQIELDLTNSVTGAATGTGTYWFAPDFGLVRQKFTVSSVLLDTDLVTELESSSVPLP